MNWIEKNLAYCRYLALHKFFVFRAGLLTGAPLYRLIIHDWSKLRPSEWVPYREFFYGERTADVKAKFERAWLSHVHWNKHHWDHWTTKDGNTFKALPMPDKYVREMVADWAGAGRAIKGKWDLSEWYQKNSSDMLLHLRTRIAVEWHIEHLEKRLEALNEAYH
jgi:hypothetical protein